MAALPVQGYEDWFRVTEWQSPALLDLSVQPLTPVAPYDSANFFVGRWHGLILRIYNAGANSLSLRVDWANTESGTYFDAETYHLRSGTWCDVCPVNRGKFVHFYAVASVGNTSLTLRVTPTNQQLSYTLTPQNTWLTGYQAVVLGGGAARNDYTQRTHPGRAQAFFFSTVAPATLDIEAEQENGSRFFIDHLRIVTANVPQSKEIWLPSLAVRCRTTNSTGGAGTFYLSLWPAIL